MWDIRGMRRTSSQRAVGSNQYRTRMKAGAPTSQVQLVHVEASSAPPEPENDSGEATGGDLRITWSEVSSRGQTDRLAKNRVYVGLYGSDVVQEPTGPMCSDPDCRCSGREVDHKVWRRYRRAAIQQMKDVVFPLGASSNIRWSSTAGCSCGCSPGFITSNEGYGSDISVMAVLGDITPDCVSLSTVRRDTLPLSPDKLAEWFVDTDNEYLRQEIVKHPDCPDHIRAMHVLSSTK